MRVRCTTVKRHEWIPRIRRGARNLTITLAVCIVAAALALQPAQQSYAAGTLDQSYEIANSAVPVGGTNWVAQTFTAGLTGNIDQLDLVLQSVAFQSTDQIVIEVRSTLNGLPTGSAITSGTLAEASIENQLPQFVSLSVPPAPVVAGTQYAIVIHKPGGPPNSPFTLAAVGST